ncbi:MAG: hypothetical protein OEY87_06765, partial [Gammaproteobacteria bacterium]|nr:hypothetical protein [Gammaproteobacteria bacterium]
DTPDGKTESQQLNEKTGTGIFTIRFTPSNSGIYAATVIAKSKTFQRQQFFSFRASVPETTVISPEPVTAEPEPVINKPEPEPAAETKTPIPVEPITEPEGDFVNDILIFIGINIIILFIGTNVYFAMKLMKNKKSEAKKEPEQ